MIQLCSIFRFSLFPRPNQDVLVNHRKRKPKIFCIFGIICRWNFVGAHWKVKLNWAQMKSRAISKIKNEATMSSKRSNTRKVFFFFETKFQSTKWSECRLWPQEFSNDCRKQWETVCDEVEEDTTKTFLEPNSFHLMLVACCSCNYFWNSLLPCYFIEVFCFTCEISHSSKLNFHKVKKDWNNPRWRIRILWTAFIEVRNFLSCFVCAVIQSIAGLPLSFTCI